MSLLGTCIVHVCLFVCLFRTESVEKESMLRTRAMKERDEVKMAVRHYRFVLLRIRFPDGLVLQGTI